MTSPLIKANSKRTHDELDFDAVRNLFANIPATDLRPEIVSSPYHLFAVESLRDKYKLRGKPKVATDVFVWAKGEPLRRDVTKIGGLPYWPKGRWWPTVVKSGAPYRFLAQFNFTDSRDLVGELPGDLLLVLTEGDSFCEQSDSRFEWLRTEKTPLAERGDLPVLIDECIDWVFWGVIYRTADYPDATDKARATAIGQYYWLPNLSATKIGGAPVFIQGDSVDDIPRGRFLCQLNSVKAAPGRLFPWVNRKTPLGLGSDARGIHGPTNSLMFGDIGALYFFLTPRGEVRMTCQCY